MLGHVLNVQIHTLAVLQLQPPSMVLTCYFLRKLFVNFVQKTINNFVTFHMARNKTRRQADSSTIIYRGVNAEQMEHSVKTSLDMVKSGFC